jgi:type I restriction enzyme S subunit
MTLIDGWKDKRLDECGAIFSGATPSTTNPAFWDGDIVWITPADLSKQRTAYVHDSGQRITSKGLASCSAHLLQPGSVVLSSRAPIGYVALPTVPFCTNQGCKSIQPKEGIDSHFLYYSLLFNVEKIKRIGEGTTFAEISKTALSGVAIEVPEDPVEQQQIAEVLTAVDQAIERTEALATKQRRIQTGLMQDLLTRGVDHSGAIRSEHTHQFKDSPIGRIPVEWDAVPLKIVSEFVTSGSRGWARYYSIDGALFLRIGNLTRDHINLRFDDVVRVVPPKSSEGRRTSVAPGDLLISITADLGIIGVIPDGFEEAYVNQHIALVRVTPSKANSRFLGWFLSSRRGQSQFERLNESGAKAGLNLPTIERLIVPTTKDPHEQAAIAQVLDATTRSTHDTLRRLEKLRRFKAGLMQDLLTGRKRVTPLLAATAELATQA